MPIKTEFRFVPGPFERCAKNRPGIRPLLSVYWAVWAITITQSAIAAAEETAHIPPTNNVSLDLFAFSQSDKGGNPYREEGFFYGAAAAAFRLELTDTIRMNMNGTVGYIKNNDPQPLPTTVVNAQTTSASPNIVTFNGSGRIDINPGGGRFTYSPSLYYAHQSGYVVFGGDFAISGAFRGGDTILTTSYSLRVAWQQQPRWDGGDRATDWSRTHNLLLGWQQVLSPRWLTSLSLQYTRQDGLLSNPANYVIIFDANRTPSFISDEALPRTRNRVQINARLRYALGLGRSIGLDGSFYADDWAILHGAIEPNIEFPLFKPVRARLWYRFAAQRRTKHFISQPSAVLPIQTQDADLDTFVLHNPGVFLLIPMYTPSDGGLSWTLRLTGYGFYRSDRVFAGGGNMGVMTSW